ncbi:MAG TPA: squalene/phytoene synthase family protein [Thermomicrobiaceae bacterium]|nr:squalene/phytoene synthase family protein [Thermomicrobiaceae bacterium]
MLIRNPLRIQRGFTEVSRAPSAPLTGIPQAAAPRAALDLASCERYCRDLTRREAKNFYWGFVALPRARRIAVYALYGFARQIDDAVDLDGGHLADDPLRPHRLRLERCLAGEPDDPVMRVLAAAVERYAIPREELEALLAGVAMDLSVTRYETWSDFQQYCRGVASTVGRMCVRIFGYREPVALEYAVDLGIAMQLANALRDVAEDFARGRVYLPQEDLRRFGVEESTLASGRSDPAWEALMAFEIERGRELFRSGLRVTQLIPHRASACVLTMAGLYQAILEQLALQPGLPLERRLSLSGGTKLAVMTRSWLRAV